MSCYPFPCSHHSGPKLCLDMPFSSTSQLRNAFYLPSKGAFFLQCLTLQGTCGRTQQSALCSSEWKCIRFLFTVTPSVTEIPVSSLETFLTWRQSCDQYISLLVSSLSNGSLNGTPAAPPPLQPRQRPSLRPVFSVQSKLAVKLTSRSDLRSSFCSSPIRGGTSGTHL